MKLSFLLSLLVASCDSHILGQTGRQESPSTRSVRLKNQSGRRIGMYWVNNLDPSKPETFVDQSDDGEGLAYGAESHLSSFVGHQFELREMPGKKSGRCIKPICWSTRFIVNYEEDQELAVGTNFVVHHTDTHQRAQEEAQKLLDQCQKKAKDSQNELSDVEMIDHIADCMKQKTDEKISIKQEEVSFQAKVRSTMAENLIPFACGDVNFTESMEMRNETWNYLDEDIESIIRIHHHRPTSMIVEVRDLAEDWECEALQALEAPNGQIMFDKMETLENGDHAPAIFDIANKFYELVATIMEWNEVQFSDMADLDETLFYVHRDANPIEQPEKLCTDDDMEQGPEKLTSCQLAGQVPVAVDTKHVFVADDEKHPGAAHVATAFLFCDKPINNQLGALHFPYAGVHIQPRPKSAVIAVHKYQNDEGYDGFVQDYHLCPNHQVYTHDFYHQPHKVRDD